MSSEKYIKAWDHMTEDSKKAMSDLFDTGINNSGVYVRYGAAEDTAAIIVEAERAAAKEEALAAAKEKLTTLFRDRCRENRAISYEDICWIFSRL